MRQACCVIAILLAASYGAPAAVTVMLLDLLNTSWTDQIQARRALVAFLEQIQPQDHIAIFALGAHSLTLLHDYTTNATSLVVRLKQVHDEGLPEFDASTPHTEPFKRLGLDALFDAH